MTPMTPPLQPLIIKAVASAAITLLAIVLVCTMAGCQTQTPQAPAQQPMPAPAEYSISGNYMGA